MGIRTFLNVITDEEARVLSACPDAVIRALIGRLYGLQSVSAGCASGSDAQAGICVRAVLRELLEEAKRNKPDGKEREIYLEVGTKFWEVEKLCPNMCRVKYGKKSAYNLITGSVQRNVDADDFMRRKVAEKRKKGYRKVNRDQKKVEAALKVLQAIETKAQTSQPYSSPSSPSGCSVARKRGRPASATSSFPAKRRRRVHKCEVSSLTKEEAVSWLEQEGHSTRGTLRTLRARIAQHAAGETVEVAVARDEDDDDVDTELQEGETGGRQEDQGERAQPSGDVSDGSSDARANTRYHASLDKCGALVSCVASALVSQGRTLQQEHELLLSLLNGVWFGTDVAYGAARFAKADTVRTIEEKIRHISPDDVAKFIEENYKRIPSPIGGIAQATTDDVEYCQFHVRNLQLIMRHAVECGAGLMICFQ